MTNLERYLSIVVLGREPIRRKRKQRRGPARDWRYRAWIRTLDCCCGCGHRPCHAAHTGDDKGMSMKPSDYSCVPLFWICHRDFDSGRARFERKHGICMEAIVARLKSEWKLRPLKEI